MVDHRVPYLDIYPDLQVLLFEGLIAILSFFLLLIKQFVLLSVDRLENELNHIGGESDGNNKVFFFAHCVQLLSTCCFSSCLPP